MKQGIFIRLCMVNAVLLLLSVFVSGRVYADICPTPPCVDSADIYDGQVKTSDLSNGAVSTNKLKNNAVTGVKVLDGSLTGADIQDGTITAIDIGCRGNSINDIMVKVGPLCVDKYEASVWSKSDGTGIQYGTIPMDDYPLSFPDTGNWTAPLYAVSMVGVTPSTSITWFQAQQACALSGKRLLTNAEWQMAAVGTPDNTTCNVSSGDIANTGSFGTCVSNYGVNDMVGNVWEWVADWMQGNTTPWAPSTFTATNAAYGSDWIYGINPAIHQGGGQNFPAALSRGGSYGNGTSAGVFALYAAGPSYSGALGFRCAR